MRPARGSPTDVEAATRMLPALDANETGRRAMNIRLYNTQR
jgi:hypothetical protein